MRFLKFYILLLFLLFASMGFAQESDPLAVHFDKSFYVLGEKIWYQVYCADDSKAGKMLEVQIADQKGTVQLHQRLLLENGCAFGDFRIPLDWTEGIYSFNLLVKIAPDKALHYQRSIPIFNDMVEIASPNLVDIPANENPPVSSGPLKIQIITDKETYRKREKIQVQLQVTDSNGQPVEGNFSMAVKDNKLVPVLPAIEQLKTVAYLQNPLNEGELLYIGKVRDKESGLGRKMNLVAIYNVNEVKVNWGRSADDGALSFALPPFYGDREVQIRDFDLFGNSAPFTVDLESAISEELLLGVYPENLLERTPAIKQYLHWSKERKRIGQVMGLENLNFSNIATETNTLIPDRTYPVADYIAFNSFEEFLDEVVLPARLRERKGQQEFRLINPNTKVWYEKAPLYLLDGYITTREEAILSLKLEEIERIDLYIDHNTLTRQFGVFGGNGVMAVYTKNRGEKLTEEDLANTFTIKGFHQPQHFAEGQEKNTDRHPDFRPLVFWQPNIQTDANGRATVEFYHSDDISQFLIEVVGIGAGQFAKAHTTYVCAP